MNRRVYLDHNASTPVHPEVLQAMLPYFSERFGNPSSVHGFGREARDGMETAREQVTGFLKVSRDEVVFTSGGTESDNLGIKGVAAARGSGHIITSQIEHHAVLRTVETLAGQGFTATYLPVDGDGMVNPDDVKRALRADTILVSLMGANSEVGTLQPIREIGRITREAGVPLHVDGVQTFGKVPMDVGAFGIDLLSFSGHKIYGPTGIGVLYGREDALAETPPWQGGGNMIADVTLERSLYQGLPNKFEAGTGNIADAVGLGEALRYVQRVGIERIAAYEHALLEYATPRLADIPGVRLVGTAAEKASVLSFVLAGHEPLEVGKALNAEGIAVRAGHHCAQPILRRYGLEATVRPSFAFYNTHEEIDVFLNAVRRIAEGGANIG